jgi:protein-disulfide isomerase
VTHRPSHVRPRTARPTLGTARLAATASLLLALLFTASTFATAAAQATEEPELTWAPLVTLRPIAEPPFLTPSELEDGYSLGSPDAPVAIEVWEDFQCPYCQRFAFEVKPAIVARFVETGQARLTFRNLAFLGDESQWAAVAASLAAEQDRFWPFHDYLFGNLLGENVGSYSLERLLAIGEAIGLDMGRFREGLVLEVARERFAELDAEARAGAAALGISSTPTVTVNGVPLGSPDLDTVSAAIEAALTAASMPSAAAASGEPSTGEASSGASPGASPAAQ